MPAKSQKAQTKAQAEETELDISELADSLEALLSSYSDDAKDGLEEAQKNAQKLLKKTRAALGDAGDALSGSSCPVISNADGWVRDNPIPAAGISAAVGVVLGILLARR